MNGFFLILALTLTPGKAPMVVADFTSAAECRQAADKANALPDLQTKEAKEAGALFVCATVEAD